MKKYLVTYENERGEIFEDKVEAESRSEAEEIADDTAWDMGGSVIRIDEIKNGGKIVSPCCRQYQRRV